MSPRQPNTNFQEHQMSTLIAQKGLEFRLPALDRPVLARSRAAVVRLLGAVALFGALLLGSNAARADEGPTRADVTQAFFQNMSWTIAKWAHPTLDADATKVIVDADGVHIKVWYKPTDSDSQPDFTAIFVPVDELGRFGRMVVERNSTFVPPFLLATLVKSLATQIMETQVDDSDDHDKSVMLRAIQQKLRDEWRRMDGNDLCRYVLMYRWVDSGSWGRFINT
jgi:hypothetical protein